MRICQCPGRETENLFGVALVYVIISENVRKLLVSLHVTKMSSFFTSSSIFTKFKDAIFKGESDLFNFGAPLGDYGSVLNSKLKQASSVVTKANTLNDVENERVNRQLK